MRLARFTSRVGNHDALARHPKGSSTGMGREVCSSASIMLRSRSAQAALIRLVRVSLLPKSSLAPLNTQRRLFVLLRCSATLTRHWAKAAASLSLGVGSASSHTAYREVIAPRRLE